MEPRALLLTIPSFAVLLLLVWHSWRALPRRRAAAFWGAVAVYGLLRGVAVAWVTEEGLGASLPYRVRDPLLEIFGVSLQEVAGWAIVAYLAWWLGERFARRERDKRGGPRLFLQAAWGCLFLGAISWAVETAAVAAGWWHWTVPAGGELLLRVPWIGLVDWLFVGTDFLLPFLALTAPALAGRPARFLALLLFPLHMASHLWLEPVPGTEVPGFHLVHWLLLGLVIWLALRSPVEDAAFLDPPGRLRWFPAAALGIVLLDLAVVELWLVGRPVLTASLVPAAGVALLALRPGVGAGLSAGSLIGSLALPPLLLGAMPGVSVLVLRFGRRHRWAAPAFLAWLAVLAFAVHTRGARTEEELRRRLDVALAARDRGELGRAMDELHRVARDHPGSHVPLALLGEIQYRLGRTAEAQISYQGAVEIKPDFVEGHRYLAVIHRQKGRPDAARAAATRGLEVAPGDLELRFLAGQPVAEIWPAVMARGPDAAWALAALAWEVGDAAGSVELLERGAAQWPADRELRQLLERVSPGAAAPPAPPATPGPER